MMAPSKQSDASSKRPDGHWTKSISFELNDIRGAAVAIIKELDLDPKRVNVNGWARWLSARHRAIRFAPADDDAL